MAVTSSSDKSKQVVFVNEDGFWKAKIGERVVTTCKTEKACRRNFDLFAKNYPHLL